jgi:hypothetical protein
MGQQQSKSFDKRVLKKKIHARMDRDSQEGIDDVMTLFSDSSPINIDIKKGGILTEPSIHVNRGPPVTPQQRANSQLSNQQKL